MAQQLFTDKIGTLTHSAGNITMAASLSSPSYLTIGGRQYTVTSNLVVALPTLAANNRYQVFAVVSGGVPVLVISQNENSVGPAGYTSWKLVGSLYANGESPVTFGSFVNITGVPATNTFIHTPVYTADTVNPTVGTILLNALYVRRYGDTCFADWVFRQSVAGSGGTGNYQGSLPFLVNSSRAKVGLSTLQGNQGSARLNTAVAGGEYGGYIYLASTSGFGMFLHDESTGPTVWSSGFGSFTNTNMDMAASFSFPVQGWSNTPIEDL